MIRKKLLFLSAVFKKKKKPHLETKVFLEKYQNGLTQIPKMIDKRKGEKQ
jgi:hypothetical protein